MAAEPSSHSAVAEKKKQEKRNVQERCDFCNERLFPIVADKTGKYHEYCATLIKGKPSTCGMCGELILHYGNGKVHENCRRIRDAFSEGCAKELLHNSTKKRLNDDG